MKILLSCLIILFLSCGVSRAADNEAPLTLKDCYNLSLKQSESIAINNETIKEAEAHFIQSLGLLLPHASFSSTEYWKDLSGTSSLYSKRSVERKFNFKQTLFSGFKEFAGMSGSNMERGQRVNEKKRAEQLLLVDVANAFYLLIEQKENLNALEATKAVLISRINELKKRERLGRSRKSEVVNAQTQLYDAEAQIEAGKSQMAVARQLLEFLTGRPVKDIVDTGLSVFSSNPNLETAYLSKVIQRPDVQAAQQARDVAKKKLTISKSDLFPTVTAEGNYYSDRTTSPQDSKWDANLKVDVPIFKGTETYGAIKEARAKAREAELQFMRTKRLAVQDIKDSYEKFKAGRARTSALKKALASARMNYKLQKGDYQLSLVNNLEVLQAIQTLQDARRNFIHSLYETKRLYWQLCASAGEATMENKNDAF